MASELEGKKHQLEQLWLEVQLSVDCGSTVVHTVAVASHTSLPFPPPPPPPLLLWKSSQAAVAVGKRPTCCHSSYTEPQNRGKSKIKSIVIPVAGGHGEMKWQAYFIVTSQVTLGLASSLHPLQTHNSDLKSRTFGDQVLSAGLQLQCLYQVPEKSRLLLDFSLCPWRVEISVIPNLFLYSPSQCSLSPEMSLWMNLNIMYY